MIARRGLLGIGENCDRVRMGLPMRAYLICANQRSGSTLLCRACQHGCISLVPPLLARGASPRAPDAAGVSPIHYGKLLSFCAWLLESCPLPCC